MNSRYREFEKYANMAHQGFKPERVYRQAKSDGMDEITLIRMLRNLYNLSLKDAKEVIARDRGCGSASEMQGELAEQLQALLAEMEKRRGL